MWPTKADRAIQAAIDAIDEALLRERYAAEDEEREAFSEAAALEVTDLDADRFWEFQEQKALERERSALRRLEL